jgi:hypothetical protein
MCTSRQRKLCGECKVCFERSFFSTDKLTKNKIKKIIDCWDYEKNKIHPKYIFKRSHKIQSFTCDLCYHPFERSPDRITRGSWCNYCGKKALCEKDCKICHDKSLASFKEKTKKGNLKISCIINNIKPLNQIFKGSEDEYSFKCDVCFHPFSLVLYSITGKNLNWCPYCKGKKFCVEEDCVNCFNLSFASYQGRTSKDKLKIECLLGEVSPREIQTGVKNIKYSFRCDVCDNTFKNMAHNIARQNQWCTFCHNKTEGKFKYWFEKNFKYKIEHQVSFIWCRGKTNFILILLLKN